MYESACLVCFQAQSEGWHVAVSKADLGVLFQSSTISMYSICVLEKLDNITNVQAAWKCAVPSPFEWEFKLPCCRMKGPGGS